MLTKIMKWVSIAMLLLAALRLPSAGYEVLLEFVVCVSGLLAMTQAVRAGKYLWAGGFTAILVLFNPIVPVTLSRQMFLWLDGVCIVAFAASLVVLKKRQPPLSTASVTGQTASIESL